MGERIDISRHEAWVTDDLGNVIGIVGPTGKKNYFLTSPAEGESSAEAQARHLAELREIGASPIVYVAASDDVTRNSVNDATDANEFTHATVVIPTNNLAVRGSRFVVVSKWECTNSAVAKTITGRINGSSVGSSALTNVASGGQEQPLDMIDSNTLVAFNSFFSAGTGTSGNSLIRPSVAGLGTAGFTYTWTSKWPSATAGEFIRLVQAKIVQINP